MTGPSHQHIRVQTRTAAGGWVTREWSVQMMAAFLAAEHYATTLQVAARVVLGEQVWYVTEPEEVAS